MIGEKLLLIGAILILCFDESFQVTKNNSSERTSALMPGDFIIGVLFSLRHQPKQKKTGPNHFLACGEIRELYGIQRSEVTFQTIDEINSNTELLPNITLGVEIRDSCWYAPVALQQTIELIRDSISPQVPQIQENCSPLENSFEAPKEIKKKYSKPDRGKNLIGVIGPGSSSVALQVQNLLQLFSIPQIGYSTTSKDLSDKARYSTFMRVVPSDYYQAQVMVDIVRRFNWTYISAVNTDENYGQSGIQAFRELAEKFGVCIAREDSILSNADDESFSDVLRNLEKDPNANVVVCFCEGMTVRGLLSAMKRLNLTDRFLLIGSDGWADRADVVSEVERQALGSISIRIHSPYVKSFDPYYFSLNPFHNKRNPWFKEFWEGKFQCKIIEEELNVTTALPNGERICTGNEKLSNSYKQEPKLSMIIKAIYTMAYALDSMQKDLCGKSSLGLCPAMYPFNGTQFLDHLMNVSFSYGPDGDPVKFDSRGDPPGRYDIMNYQLNNGTFDYVLIGEWNNGSLNLPQEPEYPTGPVESVCSKPCSPGFYKNLQTGGQEKRCCWVCVPCDKHQILKNESHCEDCDLGYYPDKLHTTCLQIPIEHVQWGDTEALVAICFALIGFILAGIVFVVFIKHNNTPVVKSSTRELCYLILVGMIFSHSSVFSIIAKPSVISCTISRTFPGISFSMIYASLLVKTNRIARILAGSKKRFPTRKPRFMSAGAQLVITSLLVSIEVAVALTMLILEPPQAELQYPTRPRAVLACNTSARGVLVPLAFIFLLIGLCTLYALKTRNVPENFNEAKFIGFSMYTTCVIWVAFVPIYFGSESKVITMCLCISLSTMVTLSFIFIPKLYIILIRPEKNIRALFTTSKTIRCHIGSRVASALSHKTSSSFSSGPGVPDEYERELVPDHPKPIIRSSSCQTSLELLNALFDIQTKYIPATPKSNWSQLDVNNLSNFSKSSENVKTDFIQINPPNYEQIIKNPKKNKVYDYNSTVKSTSQSRIQFSEATSKPQQENGYYSNNLKNLSNKKPSSLKARKVPIKSALNQKSKYVNKELCLQCTELEESRLRLKNFSRNSSSNRKLEENYNKSVCELPVYTINNSNRSPNVMKATISEESLSECSLSESESCNCKFKSITIKLASPNFQL